MQLEADKIYQGTSQINLGTGPGRPWCRYATGQRLSLEILLMESTINVLN